MAEALALDPSRPNWITILGRKGEGKSVLAHRFWTSYPRDRLVIDPTGDVDAGDPKDVENLTVPLPTRWPRNFDEKRSTLRFVPDMGSPEYLDDMDRAVGLAFTHGDCLLWVDEIGELTTSTSTPPHMRRLLHQSRHRRISTLFCGPRPKGVNPLVLSQADYVAMFHTPNPDDRKRVADATGVELGELDDAHNELVEHGFLWWDARAKELFVCPPLPIGQRAKTFAGERFDEPADA